MHGRNGALPAAFASRQGAPMSIAQTARAALSTGSIASAITTAALAGLAKARGKGVLQPTNSTSHWLHGERAAEATGADLAHTGVGYATHHASTAFWAAPLEAWLAARPARNPADIFGRAIAVAGIAALVDYALVPKRFTPGWENVLPPRDIAVVYGVLAIGLAAGAMMARRGRV